jgi:hypothetical protein
MPRRPVVVAALFTALILGARLLFPAPALSDPAGGVLESTTTLSFPLLNLLLAPLFDLWDGVTMLAMPRLHAFLLGAILLLAVWSMVASAEGWKVRWGMATLRLGLGLAWLLLFVLIGAAWRRPMAHLTGAPENTIVADLHSHTTVSHDVAGWLQDDFDIEASRAWHARGGFWLFFVTDHNRTDGWTRGSNEPPVVCPGEELSLRRAHIVVLGNVDSIPRSAYADSLPGIARILSESESRWGGVTVASIPEYNDNHFDALPQWIADGLDGFEISNPAPKANRQRLVQRDSVIALARANGRWLAGVSDQHGLGATVQAWTLIRVTENYDDLCANVVATLKTGGFDATQVIERHRLRVDSPWPYWSTVVAVPWEGWRAAGVGQIVSWLVWIWGIAILLTVRGRRVST